MSSLVNGIIKINKEYLVDFSFIDKIIQNMAEINRD